MSEFHADPEGEAELRYRALLELEPSKASAARFVEALHDENWRVRKLAAELLARSDPTPELVDQLISVLGEKGRTGARNAAAAALGQLGALALPGLLTLLTRPDPDQRKFAAEILGDLARHEAVRGLTDALDDTDANVRAAAAEALGRVGGIEAGRALEALLGRTKEPLMRVAALEGLFSSHRPPPLPVLVPLLDDPVLRRSAYRLLGHVAHPAAVGLLLRGLLHPWREAALAGLGVRAQLPNQDEAEEVLRRIPDARAFLEKALASDDLDVRSGALLLAPALGAPQLAPAIAAACEGPLAERALKSLLALGLDGAHALLDGEVPEVLTLPREARGIAAEALLRLSDPALVSAAQILLHSGDVEGIDLGLRLLGRSRSEKAVQPLEAALAEEQTAASAARALVVLGESFPAEVTAALERFLAKGPRPHALRALARVAPERSEALLKGAYQSDDAAVRAAAAGEAGALGAAGQPLIATALMDESAQVRHAAAQSIGALPAQLAVPLLERALDDLDPAVLAAAANACARSGAAVCAPHLVRLLGSPDAQVALAALDGLDRLGALDDAGLATAAKHTDAEVLKAVLDKGAWRASGVARAQQLLAHQSWDVRAAAARALATSGDRTALNSLHLALERETDSLARELLSAAAAALAGR